jgi:hypothetical protein
MKRSFLLIVAGFVAGVLSAPATARAVDTSISGPLERIARSVDRIATILEKASSR